MILHYYEKGNKNDPTVVFIHGSASDATVWLKEINIVAAKGFHCIALDLRGHGETRGKIQPLEHVKLDFETHLQDIKDTLRFLKILPSSKVAPDAHEFAKFSIVTHSFGGILAVHLTKQYPFLIDRLILACMPPKLSGTFKLVMNFFLGKPLDIIQKNLDFFADMPLRKRYKSSITTNAHVLQEIFKHVKQWSFYDYINDITCPVYFAGGRFDFVARPKDIRKLHELLPNSHFELFKWSSHAIMEDEPHKFEEWLLESLN